MHLILTGATGLVGSGVLDAMIKMKEVTKISILSRRPVAMAEAANDPRINVIINKDFEEYDPAVLSQLKGAQGCVWALGISQSQVEKEEYIKITKTFAVKAAKAFRAHLAPTTAEPFHFVYVSGMGAKTEPGRFTPLFGRVKGETELQLANMRSHYPGEFCAVSMRPAGVDGFAHQAIQAYLPTPPLALRLTTPVLLPAIRALWPGMSSPTEPLGRFLTELAMGRHAEALRVGGDGVQKIGEFPIIENSAFRRMAKLDS
ncbi:nucleoside-diphosphate-sugar epimerase [Apiospora saccharicola]|uniref:Nucleoside-diphosphate-sugar epimerase n=1 Tax=Apiospora saccharicola TaxID=335842 RepID=A0ABR1UNS6_9PEZI